MSPAWLSASSAMPQVRPPSPMIATIRRVAPLCRAPIAMPSAAPTEVPAWPTPKVSKGLSARRGKGASPPHLRTVLIRSRRPERILCG